MIHISPVTFALVYADMLGKTVHSQLQRLIAVDMMCSLLLVSSLWILTHVLYCLGVHYVFDTTFSRNFSLLESQKEFVKRFQKQAEDKKALPMLASACPGMVVN